MIERVSQYPNLEKQFKEKGCETSNSQECQGIRAEIAQLKKYGNSIETVTPGLDVKTGIPMFDDKKNQPGDYVSCITSANGVCRITDKVVDFKRDGWLSGGSRKEYVLEPASNQNAKEFKALVKAIAEQNRQRLQEIGGQLFDQGLSSPTIEGILASAYFAAVGGKNPVTGKIYEPADRVGMGINVVTALLGAKATHGNKAGVGKVGPNKTSTGENLSNKANAHSSYNNLTVEQKQLIKNAENISTTKSGKQVTIPRDLNEQILWKQVQKNPTKGRKLEGMNKDVNFPSSAVFQKMEAIHKLPDGKKISIHYQYNSYTGRAYDMKIVTAKPKWPQPGVSIKNK